MALDYKLVYSDDFNTFQKHVTHYLNTGYKIHGAIQPQVHNGKWQYFQSMVKEYEPQNPHQPAQNQVQ